MRTKNKIVIFLCILITFLTANSWGWWSASNIFNSTHHNITDDSINLPGANYPDVTTKFSGDISDWTSGTTDDVRAHAGDALANGGPIGQWWYNAQKQYKEGNFAAGDWSAYYYVGLMMHLIEDQAVPAHAYNIPHGTLGHMDNLEELVFTNYHPNITGIVLANSPTSNYYAMQVYTLNATSDNYWRQYWNAGAYGGQNGTDEFPTWWLYAGENERNITRRLLGQAVGYTAGSLMSVSENLPPLVKDLQITSSSNCNNVPTIGKQTSAQISFKILENRKKTVKIFITVDGEAIISSEYGTGKSFDLSSGSDLPWEDTYTISWDGKLASGQYPSDGEHTLYVTQCEVTSHFCEKISLDRCFASIATLRINLK